MLMKRCREEPLLLTCKRMHLLSRDRSMLPSKRFRGDGRLSSLDSVHEYRISWSARRVIAYNNVFCANREWRGRYAI